MTPDETEDYLNFNYDSIYNNQELPETNNEP